MAGVLWPNGSTTRPNISSPFGARTSPIAGASSNHRGTDFTGFSTVRAVADGTVAAVGTPVGWSGGGTQVWVWHDGFLSRSLHMVKGSPVVKVGQSVKAGDALGTMGMTGTATGVHLHLEVVVNGIQVDPVPFITTRLATTAGGASATPAPTLTASEEDDMKFHLFQLDPQVDGRWVVVNFAAGTFWVVSNGAQLDLVRKLPNVTELAGPQPKSFIDGLTLVHG